MDNFKLLVSGNAEIKITEGASVKPRNTINSGVEEMIFHWEDAKGNKGKFKVSSFSVDECIKIAEEELKGRAEITDYYSI